MDSKSMENVLDECADIRIMNPKTGEIHEGMDRAKELLQKMYDEHIKGYQREFLLIKQSSVWAIEAHFWKIAFSFTDRFSLCSRCSSTHSRNLHK